MIFVFIWLCAQPVEHGVARIKRKAEVLAAQRIIRQSIKLPECLEVKGEP